MESNISSSSYLAPSKSVATLIRTMSDLANTTHQTVLQNMTVTNGNMKEHGTITSRRHFLHLIGGWLLTAIFLFGISFLFITHFLGRREWRRYQQRLEEERKAVNHVIVDPKFMKYTKKGWKDIAFSL